MRVCTSAQWLLLAPSCNSMILSGHSLSGALVTRCVPQSSYKSHALKLSLSAPLALLVTHDLEFSCNDVAVLTNLCIQGRNKCWALNGQQFQPEVKGLRGLLRTYRSVYHGANIKATAFGGILKCHNAPILCNSVPRHIWQVLHMPTTAEFGLSCHS